MLIRQDSSLSSSRRQASATPPPSESHHAKSIGCMSGIFRLFSKYHHPSKRLTSGRIREKRRSAKDSHTLTSAENAEKRNIETRKLTCHVSVPRSPTIPPEIRRSKPLNSSESPRTPTSLVARLMGLEDIAAVKKQGIEEETVAEKRRRLLEALEKCNQDLEALRRIIQAVQTADIRLQPPQGEAKRGGGGNEDSCVNKCIEEAQELSPVCVLDEFTRSPVNSKSQDSGATRVSLHRKPASAKKPGEDEEAIVGHVFSKKTSTYNESWFQARRQAATISPPRSSKAMVEGVEEVCNDIAWGEKREVERIGLALQENIYKDMVDEVVQDLKSCTMHSLLPLQACKRRLCF